MARKWMLVRIGLLQVLSLTLAGAASGQALSAEPIPGWQRFIGPLLAEERVAGAVYFPAEFSGSRPVTVLDPRGFEVHLSRDDDPGEELVYTAGEPMIPPAGRWRVWLQGDWMMTPLTDLVRFAHYPRHQRPSPKLLPIVPAGRVALGEESAAGADLDLWLLYAGGNALGNLNELSRRQAALALDDGIMMPSGSTLAGLWDRRAKRWSALTRPFQVEPGRTMVAPLELPPTEESWLKVYVERPQEGPFDSLRDLALRLSQDGVEHPPDFRLTTTFGVHAVWYGLQPGPAIVAGGNGELYLEPRTVELAGGAIEHFDGVLVDRPSLQVGLVLPRVLREKPMTLEVRRLPDGDVVAKAELARRAGVYRFDRLVRGLMEVVLTTHLAKYRRQVDLSTDDEVFISLKPHLIELFGTVYRGVNPHPATLQFQTVAGDLVDATADEGGAYRAFSLQPLLWVRAELDGVEQEPWLDSLMPPIRESRKLDIEIPDAQMSVRLVDSVSGEGIAGAEIAVRSEYQVPVESDDGGERTTGSRVLGQSHVTNADGLAKLPPPRPGRMEITASADHYRPMQQPLVLEIDDPPQDRDLEILLEPASDEILLRLTLPGGSPAAGAEILRLDPASPGTIFFTGRADATGAVDLPTDPPHGLLLLKHPRAAFGVIEWSEWRDQQQVDWTFPAAAGSPLSLRIWDPAGEEPARDADLALWVDDRRLSGQVLLWLLDTRPRTDHNGFWTARGLPRHSVRVLAWSRDLSANAASGALDTLATLVPYPWPPTVDIRIVR